MCWQLGKIARHSSCLFLVLFIGNVVTDFHGDYSVFVVGATRLGRAGVGCEASNGARSGRPFYVH